MTKDNEEDSEYSIRELQEEIMELGYTGKAEELEEPEVRSIRGIFEGFEGPEDSLHFGDPVNKLVDLILLEAIRGRASDIYLELSNGKFKVRYNIDNILYEVPGPPRQLYKEFVEDLEMRFGVWGIEKKKVKKMFNRIGGEEKVIRLRRFDDGDFVSATTNCGGKKLSLYLMKIASRYGDIYHLKVFYHDTALQDRNSCFENDKEKVKKIEEMLKKEKGIILVSGFPNNGRTTTIYNLFEQTNRQDKINVAIGRTFVPQGVIQFLIGPSNPDYARKLKTIRKLSPNVVSIEDITDSESVKEAEHYANAGALVFASVPSADAIKGIEYLASLGIGARLLAENLRGVIGQRLVRRICNRCREVYGLDKVSEKIKEVKLAEVEHEKFLASYGKGCDKCNNTGYYGMSPVFQIIGPEDKEMKIIKQRLKEGGELEQILPSLYQLTKAKVLEGVTTIEELSKI